MAVSNIIDFAARLNGGWSRHEEVVRVPNTRINMQLVYVLYLHGVISDYHLDIVVPMYTYKKLRHCRRAGRHPEAIHSYVYIRMWMRYGGHQPAMKMEIIPKYETKRFFSFKRVFTDFYKRAFSGFFLLRTKKGIFITTHLDIFDLSWFEAIGGEVLMRIRIVADN